MQKFTDASLTECPGCTGDLRKVFNAVGVVFKGSGFYATDTRTKGKTDAAKPATSAPAAESSPPAASAPAASATPAKGSAA